MASKLSQPHIGSRGLDILAALDCSPLTARQVQRLSTTWQTPFTSLRSTFDALQLLDRLQLVCARRYAAIPPAQPENYYTLAAAGYRLLHGPDAQPPPKSQFSPVSLSRQPHTRALADFIVHTFHLLSTSPARVTHFHRENALRLDLGEECLYPDCTLQLDAGNDGVHRYFVEVDLGTERITSTRTNDSLEHKLCFYDRLADAAGYRFRVPFIVASSSRARLDNILSTFAHVTTNPARRLVYAVTLAEFLAAPTAHTPVFRDHNHDRHGLLGTSCHAIQRRRTALQSPARV